MSFELPPSLQTDSDEQALSQLRGYYDPPFGSKGSCTGAAFDDWDSTGHRADDLDRFTADDLVAVTFLSVKVLAPAAYRLLGPDSGYFNDLLAAVGKDRDFVEVAPEETTPDSAAWTLERELRTLPEVGHTIASKLMARKRPRLVPIYDDVLRQVMGLDKAHWLPLNAALRAGNQALHHRLLALRDKAELPASVSALRVLDVIAWRDGKTLATDVAAWRRASPGGLLAPGRTRQDFLSAGSQHLYKSVALGLGNREGVLALDRSPVACVVAPG
ncbi:MULTISPECIES: DUF6308 family protein [unclassified Knoellia]|uniref:DUF6308 family protein n=1 Tax=Knoellia altitudinis TaxID=3404795 RepID=UPI0036212C37